MSASDMISYYQEVFGFLNSLTIKFSPLVTAMNTQVTNAGGTVDTTSPETWKYYLNAVGQYHPSDTVMTILSLDTQQTVVFSPAMLAQNPKTAENYIPGNALYAALCTRYPSQVDLIKSIVYPASSIEKVISAEDFTIISYGNNLLESSEYDFVLQTIREFLEYIRARWYFSFFSYEPYYTWVFWGNLWQQLVAIVLTARVLSIKTTHVHSWHVWQYLKSNGLGDYSDILSREQMLFLYRNLPYILANRGKQTNLITLADYLLAGLGFGLYGRDVWQQTVDTTAQCQLTPYLVPIGIPTTYINALPEESAESVAQIEQRLYTMGTEVSIDTAHLTDLTTKFSTTPLNTFPTKLLELRPIATDLKFSRLLNNFLLDSLVYAISKGLYTTTIDITEPITSVALSLSALDALFLYSYCAFRSLSQSPTELPTNYVVKTAFAQNSVVPTTVVFGGHTYPVTCFTNPTAYLGAYQWPVFPSITPTEFTNVLSTQFLAMVNQVQISRMEENTISNIVLQKLTNSVVAYETISFSIPNSMTTYADWLAIKPSTVTSMLTTLDAQANVVENYSNLADLILSTLLPPTPTFALYGNFTFTGKTYSRFKELFVQLCSYNVLFMDADPTVEIGVFLGKMSSYVDSSTVIETVSFPLESPLRLSHTVSGTMHCNPVSVNLQTATKYRAIQHSPHSYSIKTNPQATMVYRMTNDTWIQSSVSINLAPIQFNARSTERNYLRVVPT